MATFTNQATLTYNNIVTNSNIATGEVLDVLSATKTAVTETYVSGGDVTYVISILNSGVTPITGVSITDNLGAYTIPGETFYPLAYRDGSVRLFVNGILQSPPTVTTTPNLVISGITIPAGGNAVVIYEAQVTEYAPLGVGDSIENSATIAGNGISSPVQVTETVTPVQAPRLTISKTISPSVVAENSRVTYTFVIQNFGNTAADAGANAVITDNFDPILTDLVVTLNATPLTPGVGYTYDEGTGDFATIAGQITVPAATFTQDPATGLIITTPGTATLTVTGTI